MQNQIKVSTMSENRLTSKCVKHSPMESYTGGITYNFIFFPFLNLKYTVFT